MNPEEHLVFLRNLARALVGPGEADDVVQETMAIALARPPAEGNARGWLAAVARNVARMRRRGETRRKRREAAVAAPKSAPSTAETVARIEVQRRVADALERLTEPERGMLVLRYFEEESISALARRYGVSRQTVRDRLASARARLRADLDRAYGDRSWALALLPLLRPPKSAAPTAGAIVMSGKTKLALAAFVLAALFLAWTWNRSGRDEPGRHAAGERTAAGALPREAGNEPDPSGAPPAETAGLLVRVVDQDGNPIAGARVGDRIADDAGRAAIERASVVLVSAAGYLPRTVRVRSSRDVALEPGLRVPLEIVDAETGAALDGATIEAWDVESDDPLIGENAPADDGGRLALPGVRRRHPFVVAVRRPGFARIRVRSSRERPDEILRIRLGAGALVEGTVRNPRGEPVAGARVGLMETPALESHLEHDADSPVSPNGYLGSRADDGTTTADEHGRFRIRGLVVGQSYRLLARADGNREGISPVFHVRREAAHRADVVIGPRASVEIVLRDRAGAPVPDARVYFDRGADLLTRGDGRFSFEPNFTGPQRITIAPRGAPSRFEKIHVEPYERTRAEFVLDDAGREQEVRLEPPFAGARVAIYVPGDGERPPQGREGTTDGTGRVVLRGLSAAPGVLWVRTPGRPYATVRREDFTPGAPVTIALERAPHVVGRVEPVPAEGRARMLVDDTVVDVPIEADGRFQLAPLQPDHEYRIVVGLPGAAPVAIPPFRLGPRERRDLGTIAGRPGRTLAGVVVDVGGAPVPGVRVELFADEEQFEIVTYTGEDGRYAFEHLPDATYEAWLSREGYVSMETPWTPKLTLARKGRLVVTLEPREGDLRAGRSILITPLDNVDAAALHAETDATGRCERYVVAGRYRVAAYDDPESARIVELLPGVRTDVTLTVPR